MKNKDRWRPSKFVYRNGRLIASRDQNEVGVGSRLIADTIAGLYDKYLREYARGKLLDLGCGKVPLFMAYKGLVTDNICMDWENTLHRNEYLDYECDITKDLPISDGEFDTIVLSDVLEHIPNPDDLWREMSRVLSVNGKIIVNVPFYYSIHAQPHDYYRYTEFALRRFVENAGLELIFLESVGGSPEVLADILAKHFSFIPFFGEGIASVVQYGVKLFVKTGLGKRLSKKTSNTFPLGYFLIAEKLP